MSLLLPTDFQAFVGVEVPDPITFVVGGYWLNRPQLYPRQATIIKLVFLRLDLLTDFDHQVIDEWEESFRQTGNRGIIPGVRERAQYLLDHGYKHFREVLLVMGRRAGKGYISALCMAYVLWMNFLSKGDPQEFYGVDKDKQLACFIFAGKKDQAKKNLWADLNNVIVGAPCFERYISRQLGESLSLFVPHDLVRMEERRRRGLSLGVDPASFIIEPKEATTMAGRGPAAAVIGFDEFAHVAATGATRSADEVWNSALPALDQFKKAAFVIEPSSPWTQVGQFYQNWCQALMLDKDESPEYPSIFMLQLESWDPYEDWQSAHHLPLLPRDFQGDLGEYVSAPLPKLRQLKVAIQEYDGEMIRQERANPEMFRVERRAHWQAVMDAYLNPQKVDEIFGPFQGRTLQMQNSGVLSIFYKGHADPSLANANFAVGVGHPETIDGVIHCVIDYLHFWRPQDFPDNTIDYLYIEDRLWEIVRDFRVDEFTLDQWNSASLIQKLQQKTREARIPKRVNIYEQTANLKHNWERAENFKVAINQGWFHAPEFEQLRDELKFLQLVSTATTNRVEKQATGPVTTKDCADVAMEICWTILGDQVHSYTHGALSNFQMSAGLQGGIDPHAREANFQDQGTFNQLGGLTSRQRNAVMRGGGMNAARNAYRRRR